MARTTTSKKSQVKAKVPHINNNINSNKSDSNTNTSAKKADRIAKAVWKKNAARVPKNYNSSDEMKFASDLLSAGFRIKYVDGDGNCLFRALGHQLENNDGAHMKYRQPIVDYIEEHADHFKLFMEDDEPFDDYISRMRHHGEWGGNQELYAASQLYQANIFVHQLDSPVFVLQVNNPKHQIHLSYHGDYHYNSLIIDKPSVEEAYNLSNGKEAEGVAIGKLKRAIPWMSEAAIQYAYRLSDYEIPVAIEILMTNNEEALLKMESDCFSDGKSLIKPPDASVDDGAGEFQVVASRTKKPKSKKEQRNEGKNGKQGKSNHDSTERTNTNTNILII